MNIELLKNLAKEYPALARLAEAALASALTYALGAAVTGEVFSLQALIVAGLTPIYMFVSKKNRDLNG